jgi:hypothetical protein
MVTQPATGTVSKDDAQTSYAVAMNVVVMPATKAEQKCRHRAGLTRPTLDEAAATSTARGKLVPGLPRTPSHNLVFRGGRTIADLSFCNFYLGGAGAWQGDARANIDDKLAKAMSDGRLNGVMAQYFNNPITSQFRGPSTVLDGVPPVAFSKGDVEALVAQLQQANTFKNFDLSRTVFNFLLPSGTELTTDDAPTGASRRQQSAQHPSSGKRPVADADDKASSLEGLGGYHGSVILGGQRIYYAIGVFSEVMQDGTQNGIVAFNEPWKNVVATMYHELNEARTDPDVEEANTTGNDKLVGWISAKGEEIGDFPIFEDTSLTHVFKEVPLEGGGAAPIQFMYSNRVNGPEDPTQ